MKLKKAFFPISTSGAATKSVTLKVHSDENKIFVFADPKRIMQVLENLISNSIKYGKEGGHTNVYFHDMGRAVLIDIADDGPGVAPEHLSRLFERFYRVDKSRTRKIG